MMEQEIKSHEEKETICEMCGDRGWENAFVFCVKCVKFAIHRYCLPVKPETFDEFVYWLCVDCEKLYGKPNPSKVPSSVLYAKTNLIAAEEVPCTDFKKRKYHKSTNNSSEIEMNLNVAKEREKVSPIKAIDAKMHDKKVHDSPPSRKRSKKSGKSRSKKKNKFIVPVNVVTELEEPESQIRLSGEPCEEDKENSISDGGKLCASVADVARVGPDSQIVQVEGSKAIDAKMHDKKVHDSPPSRKRSKKSGKSRSKKKNMFVIPVDVVTELEEPKSQIRLSGEPCEEDKENSISDGGKLCESVADVARVGPDSQIVQFESAKVPEDSNHIRSQKPSGTVSELAKSDKKVHESPPSRRISKRIRKSGSKKSTKFGIPVDEKNLISDGDKFCEAVADEAKTALDSQIYKIPDRTQKPCEVNNENVVSEGSKSCEAPPPVASVALDSRVVLVRSSKVLESCERNGENLVPEDGKLCRTAADVACIPYDSQAVSIVPEDSCYIPAQPVIDPIWSGNFNIETDKYGLLDGIVAHISSKACPMACEEANLFSESLCMELFPKSSVWPKSFQISKPTDDNIALYFFASNASYDELVSEMMSKELALRAVVTNAELLVFTSNELPLEYWKFGSKFYLWGVFRKKQAPPSNSANLHLVRNGEDKKLMKKKRRRC